jgi:hypothetical protein
MTIPLIGACSNTGGFALKLRLFAAYAKYFL